MKMIPPKTHDTDEQVVGKALIGVDLLDHARENLTALQDLERQLFLLTERLMGAEPQPEFREHLANPDEEPHASFTANLTDCYRQQRDSLVSIERIVWRLREFI